MIPDEKQIRKIVKAMGKDAEKLIKGIVVRKETTLKTRLTRTRQRFRCMRWTRISGGSLRNCARQPSSVLSAA